MQWIAIAHWVRDHLLLAGLGVAAAIFVAAWQLFETFRGERVDHEILRLRQRLYELERERGFGPIAGFGPVVLPHRWLQTGTAATTSDGGCLILLDGASPLQRKATLTVRVDGLPVRKNQMVTVGQRLEVQGKSGIYSIELQAADRNRARLGVSLRTRHLAGGLAG